MDSRKLDTLQLILQPYTLDLLKALAKREERFVDLKKYIKNERTLSLKLAKLQDYRLVELIHVKNERKYINLYKITKRGINFLNKLKNL